MAKKSSRPSQPLSTPAFDWIAVALGAIFLGGLFLDGWAHSHGRVDQTFFTPWHAALYSGLALNLIFFSYQTWKGRRSGRSFRHALPAGYFESYIGAIIFAVGGTADLIWHTLFGIEADVEASVSPSHLSFAVGFFLLNTGAWRAALRRGDGPALSWKKNAPVILSALLTLSILTITSLFWNFVTNPYFAGGRMPDERVHLLVREYGTLAMVFAAGVQIGPLLYLLRRWSLPFGAVAVIYGINGFAQSFIYEASRSLQYAVLAALVMGLAGLASDLLLRRLKPSMENVRGLRWFAALSPVATYLVYFGALNFGIGVWWSLQLWTGVCTLSAMVGLLLSYLLVPGEA